MMTLQIDAGWHLDVERGPECLLVTLAAPPRTSLAESGPEVSDLATQLWQLLDQQFTYRLVLDLQSLPVLHSQLIGQLIKLSRRLHAHGGMLRVCGLSEQNQEVLRMTRLSGEFSHYPDREDAMMGRPEQPR